MENDPPLVEIERPLRWKLGLTPPVEIGRNESIAAKLRFYKPPQWKLRMSPMQNESRLKVKVVYEGEVLYTDMLTRKQMEKLIAGMKRKGYDLEVTRIGEDS